MTKTASPVRLDIEDADIALVARVDLPAPDDALLETIVAETPWRAESITLFGKKVLQPRLIAWYGDPGQAYSYSGIALLPLPWTPTLAALRATVQAIAAEPLNSVLLNHYRDQRDSVGLHSDAEPELGPTPTIATLSLGATRTLVLKHRQRAERKPVRIELPSGSLLLMRGRTQQFWKHAIPKEARPCGPRVSLTFRRIRSRTDLPPSKAGPGSG